MGYIDDNYNGDNFDEQDFEDNAQAFFIVEPGLNALFNISRYLQLEAGIKYRISNKVNDAKNFDPVKIINGFSAGIGVKVGIFNMGRNRYKKNYNMKNRTESLCSICHDVIQTQHVFSKDNQVFLKGNIVESSNGKIIQDQWFPINFLWVSDMELRQNLIQQSNME